MTTNFSHEWKPSKIEALLNAAGGGAFVVCALLGFVSFIGLFAWAQVPAAPGIAGTAESLGIIATIATALGGSVIVGGVLSWRDSLRDGGERYALYNAVSSGPRILAGLVGAAVTAGTLLCGSYFTGTIVRENIMTSEGSSDRQNNAVGVHAQPSSQAAQLDWAGLRPAFSFAQNKQENTQNPVFCPPASSATPCFSRAR